MHIHFRELRSFGPRFYVAIIIPFLSNNNHKYSLFIKPCARCNRVSLCVVYQCRETFMGNLDPQAGRELNFAIICYSYWLNDTISGLRVR